MLRLNIYSTNCGSVKMYTNKAFSVQILEDTWMKITTLTRLLSRHILSAMWSYKWFIFVKLHTKPWLVYNHKYLWTTVSGQNLRQSKNYHQIKYPICAKMSIQKGNILISQDVSPESRPGLRKCNIWSPERVATRSDRQSVGTMTQTESITHHI